MNADETRNEALPAAIYGLVPGRHIGRRRLYGNDLWAVEQRRHIRLGRRPGAVAPVVKNAQAATAARAKAILSIVAPKDRLGAQ